MKAQFISSLLQTPWNLERHSARTILGHIVTTLLRGERPTEDIEGEPLPSMQIVGPVAIIPITGVIHMNVPQWIKSYGFNITDANDIAEELDQALADPTVETIIYDINSPGGSSLAGEKLYTLTEAASRRKPIYAWCGDGAQICSAAYHAAASSRAILAGPFAAAVGCIGTYLALLDDTDYWAQMGIKWEIFRSGDLKALGEDPLTDEQRAYLQASVDQCGATFRQSVKKYRTTIADEDLQGQWFTGTESARRGFVAGTAKDLSAAITKFRKMA